MPLSEYEIIKQNVIKKYLGNYPIVKRSRLGVDACCVGKKSIGKSFLKCLVGLQKYFRGENVYSNFWLGYHHWMIESAEDLNNLQGPCCCLIDDIESIASSKFISNRDKYPVLSTTLNFGKFNVNPFLWSSKRILEVDKSLYSQLDYVCEVNFVPKVDVEFEYEHILLSDLLNYYVLAVDVYDNDGDLVFQEDWDGLDIFCKLYSTKQIVKRFDMNLKNGFNSNRGGG